MDELKGFQIFIVPYTGSQVTEARFKQDEPSGARTSFSDVTVDGAAGAAFDSTDVALGETREAWFIHGGYLFEVTTLKPLESWFAPIMSSACEYWRDDYCIDGIEQLDLHHLYRAMAWLGEELAASDQADRTLVPRCARRGRAGAAARQGRQGAGQQHRLSALPEDDQSETDRSQSHAPRANHSCEVPNDTPALPGDRRARSGNPMSRCETFEDALKAPAKEQPSVRKLDSLLHGGDAGGICRTLLGTAALSTG